MFNSDTDSVCWQWSSDGYFSVESLFLVLSTGGIKKACVKWICSHSIPTKMQFFAWQLLHGGVLTEVALKHRGF